MDIRSFFGKKGGGGSAVPTKTKAEVSSGTARKNSSNQQRQKAVVKHKVADDDDVIVIENAVANVSDVTISNNNSKRKGSPKVRERIGSRSKNSISSDDYVASNTSSKAISPLEEHDVFLDDTDDDDFVPPIPSLPKKRKTVNSVAAPKLQSPDVLRSSPRTRKTPPAAALSNISKYDTKKKPPSSSKGSKQLITVLPSTVSQDEFDMNSATPQCLSGLTFCFTGILPDLSRDEAVEMVKILGGRVTGAVSGKTTYLVVGDVLEDGRPVDQGSKYKRVASSESNTILVHGTNYLYGLLRQYSDRIVKTTDTKGNVFDTTSTESSQVLRIDNSAPLKLSMDIDNSQTTVSLPPKSSTGVTANPYTNASTAASNPYARKSNPYAKKPTVTTATTNGRDLYKSAGDDLVSRNSYSDDRKGSAIQANDSHSQLWVDKYKPKHASEILGNQDAVRKLSVWLTAWEECFNSSNKGIKSFSSPNGPWKAALLSGPPGIGSTYIGVFL
jgi:BRCT domain type II-containing protein